MKLYTVVLLILLLLIAIPDIYFYLHLKRRESKPIYIILHLIAPIFFTCLFFYIKFWSEKSMNFRVIVWIMWLYFIFLLIYIPKIIHIIFYFLYALYKRVFRRESSYFAIARIGLTLSAIIIMLISAYITPRNFDTTHIQVIIPKLPSSFEGYKILQLSDIHLGSWNHKYNKFSPIIKLVNSQQPDLIVFTGDMVNNFAEEAAGWQPYFLEMKAKDGKYAILGNHDYGDYTDWKSNEERNNNKYKIKQYIRDFGFKLLLNENVYLKRGSDSIMLIGVENWSKKNTSNYCNLNEALGSNQSKITRILLSHDPMQWNAEVVGKKNLILTISGHTHASQLSIKIGKKLFSPLAFVFKYWEGLYKVNNQYLYVNRGIGYIGLPMMSVGVRPEITVFELRSH